MCKEARVKVILGETGVLGNYFYGRLALNMFLFLIIFLVGWGVMETRINNLLV
jgi:hypothetical protein